MKKSKVGKFYFISIFCWLLGVCAALQFGAVPNASTEIMTVLRMPRVVLASVVGMGLAVSGASLQSLFTNPLCEPYTLGISSGAALGAVLGISFGLEWNFLGLAGSAFAGAAVFSIFLFGLATHRRTNNASLLLSGVMLGFLGTSIVALWISLTDSNGMQAAIGWLFGDLSRARMRASIFIAAWVLILVGLIWSQWRELDALLLGEEGASAIGVDLPRTRRRIVLITSVLVGICVSSAGMIGFVGLVVPHFIRRFNGSMHFHLIPLAAIWGSLALVLADLGARYLARPYELPVGVVTALLGAPLFLAVVARGGGHVAK
ncbi:MAG: iron ABC transporter permease [Bdellovibrio sp.]|nr:iron ABC transporter permease [Bdellovibrio sp.]